MKKILQATAKMSLLAVAAGSLAIGSVYYAIDQTIRALDPRRLTHA